MALAIGKKWFHKILRLILRTDFYGLGSLVGFVAYNVDLPFCLRLRCVRAFSQTLLQIFLLPPFDKAWSEVLV
jgi:hypothetical protein